MATTTENWDELDSETQENLIEWFNISDPSDDDKELLAQLQNDGKFTAFTCECGETILAGQPDDWGNFQGVNQSEYHGELCSDCYQEYLRLKEKAGD